MNDDYLKLLNTLKKEISVINNTLSRQEILFQIDKIKKVSEELIETYNQPVFSHGSFPTQNNPKEVSTKKIEHPKLMVVDDDEDTQKLLKFTLKRKGFEVVSYLNPIEAIENIDNTNPDVILLDLMMPNMTGFEFVEKAEKLPNRKNYKIVIGSSRNFSNDRINILKAGADDFISKPYNITEIAMRLHNIISR